MSRELPAVLAVDGGNSKTDLALVAQDGTLLAQVRGPGMPGRLSDATLSVLDELVSSAAKLAGLAQPDKDHAAVAAHLVACVANVDLPADERRLEQMLHDQGWTGTSLVANDTFAVLRAGLDDVPAAGEQHYWGVAVTCGTGINCVGLAPDGRTARFLALGPITGDWGGGGGVGLAAQWHAIRAEDGRGPQTELRRAVPAHFGLREPSELAVAILLGEVDRGDLAGLTPVIFQAADAGDQVARGLVLRQANEIFLMARSAITQLDLAETAVPVVLGGGIIAAQNELLIGRITELILTEVPSAVVRVVAQQPVVGAALTGLDLAGASVAAKQRLRDSFAHQLAPATIQGTLAGR